MSQQRASPPAPLLPAVKCNECRIGIAHEFHGNGLIGREKCNHARLFMLYKVTLHPCKTCFGSIDKLFSQERLVKTFRPDRGNADFGKKSQETHLISIAGNAGQRSAQNC